MSEETIKDTENLIKSGKKSDEKVARSRDEILSEIVEEKMKEAEFDEEKIKEFHQKNS